MHDAPILMPLRNAAHLEELLALSAEHPLLLFKHSDSCGTSHEALDELISHIADRPACIRYAMVTVQEHRELSNTVATRLGVRHETPQAILISGGRAIWTASHFRINAGSLDHALRNALPIAVPATQPVDHAH